jgi:putative IMPACT (imprinted ancient) family translation regulator
MPFTLLAPSHYREEIRKSRFLALAAPVSSAEQAMAFLAAHSDTSASHNCWAWKVGQQYRFSDDGEPGGTAGRPILAAIEGQDMD